MSEQSSEPIIKVSFQLPTCLYLDNNAAFVFSDAEISLRTEDVFEEHDSRFGSAKGMEVVSDTDSAFRFTRIIITFADQDSEIPLDKLMDVNRKRILSCVNRFIDAYRYITGRHSIANVQNLESYRGYGVLREGGNKQAKGLFTITFGPPGTALTSFLPLRSREEHEKLQEFINLDSLPLEDLFLMDAWRQLKIGHELQALISAISSLELVSPRSVVGRIKKWIGFWKRETPFQILVKTQLEQRDANKEIIDLVVGAIRDRNRVVHDGLRMVKTDMEQYLAAIEKAVQLFKTQTRFSRGLLRAKAQKKK